MKSLRLQMMLLVGIAIVAAATLQFASSLHAAIGEANKLFDYHMQQMALALQDGDFEQVDWHNLPGTELDDFDFVVQVWSEDGARVYQSRQHRSLPKQAALGYSTVTLENGDWRVYAAEENKRVIQVAQKINARRDRAISFALSTLWPVIPVSLLLFFAVWWGINSVLAPLNRIGSELANRNANSTDPVSAAGVPREVSPLVTELNSLLNRMGLAIQAQQRFVADAAHELRSPITALRLQVQNLGRARDELSHDQAISRLLGGVDRASRLVEQLLALARQDPASQASLSLTPVSLNACIEQAISDVTPYALSRKISIHTEMDQVAEVTGDAESLRIMIRNLIDNAVRYMPNEGQVQISLKRQPGATRLSIEDSGDGIPLTERERIFDRFYRVAGSNKGGSGLGLAIAKAIADRHHASIRLGDAALGGLEVSLEFPALSGNSV
ncbi:ATP-binding protein [Undibacterium sp. TS12]|uniref:ATP-binding protein n=1 Tax=Undibacterium sp. TS12 TaxID=2908202 RepID=UPI001F4D338D|nr:ATP-binding protein [Undibacterium sp. TS12]MCH8620870.1 ATP-binding protein [Undibacterium sp. TS12]